MELALERMSGNRFDMAELVGGVDECVHMKPKQHYNRYSSGFISHLVFVILAGFRVSNVRFVSPSDNQTSNNPTFLFPYFAARIRIYIHKRASKFITHFGAQIHDARSRHLIASQKSLQFSIFRPPAETNSVQSEWYWNALFNLKAHSHIRDRTRVRFRGIFRH